VPLQLVVAATTAGPALAHITVASVVDLIAALNDPDEAQLAGCADAFDAFVVFTSGTVAMVPPYATTPSGRLRRCWVVDQRSSVSYHVLVAPRPIEDALAQLAAHCQRASARAAIAGEALRGLDYLVRPVSPSVPFPVRKISMFGDKQDTAEILVTTLFGFRSTTASTWSVRETPSGALEAAIGGLKRGGNLKTDASVRYTGVEYREVPEPLSSDQHGVV
jgi:hypothetical protein